MIDFKSETLKFASEYLKNRGIENAVQEARWLFEHAYGKADELVLMPDDDKEVKDSVARVASVRNSKLFNKLLQRRAEGEPLQYLLGEWEFYGYPMKVGEGVLIPRPETEFLVDIGKEFLEKRENKSESLIIDLCAGTGCVGIAMCKEIGCKAVEIEFEEKAAEFAQKNIELNGLCEQIEIHKGDIFDADLIDKMPEADCIFANPPYLSEKDISELQREVRHEPEAALYGGKDGLDFYRKIFKTWKAKLKSGGLFAVEVGDGQADAVARLMTEAGFEVDIMKDYAMTDRIVFTKFDRKKEDSLLKQLVEKQEGITNNG